MLPAHTRKLRRSSGALAVHPPKRRRTRGAAAVHAQKLRRSSGALAVHAQKLRRTRGALAVHAQKLPRSSGALAVHAQKLRRSSGALAVHSRKLRRTCGAQSAPFPLPYSRFDDPPNSTYLFASVLPSYDLPTIAARLARLAALPDPLGPTRQAAVAAILRPADDPADVEILLMRRAEHPNDPWSGHMAFPGGRRDDTDPSLLHAVHRETREEVGIDLERHATLLGRLPEVQAIARGKRMGLVIAPFVFALEGPSPELLLDQSEVAEALWTPLGPLARGESAGTIPYLHEGRELQLPCLRVGERVVWGLTYQMLQTLFNILHAP